MSNRKEPSVTKIVAQSRKSVQKIRESVNAPVPLKIRVVEVIIVVLLIALGAALIGGIVHKARSTHHVQTSDE